MKLASVVVLAVIVLAGLLVYSNAPASVCANSVSCIKDLSGKYDRDNQGIFMGQKVTSPAFTGPASDKVVLGESTGIGEKRIYVDLTNQKLYAFQGSTLVYNFTISSGKWYPTPTGDFRIWIKLRYTRMTGGNKAWGTYYDLPNVPYTMYFYNDQYPKILGFGLHGTYWHRNFGHPMSHGCVNLKTEDAEKLYYWTDPPVEGNLTLATDNNLGTPITIYGVTPKD